MLDFTCQTCIFHRCILKQKMIIFLSFFTDQIKAPLECKIGDGVDYKGFETVTETGVVCQRWDMKVLAYHQNLINDKLFICIHFAQYFFAFRSLTTMCWMQPVWRWPTLLMLTTTAATPEVFLVNPGASLLIPTREPWAVLSLTVVRIRVNSFIRLRIRTVSLIITLDNVVN